MRIVATRPDGALHVSLDGGLSVILLGERSSNCAESSVIEAMGPWTEADNSLAARRAVAKRLDSARTSPLAAMSLVDAPPPPVSADALTAKAADHQRIAWADDNNVEKIAEAATEQAKEAMAMSGKAKTAEEHRKAAEALDAAAAAMVEVEKLRAPAPTPAIAAAAKMIVAGQAAPKVAAPDPAAAQARVLSETIDALDAVRTKLLTQIDLVGQGRGWHADGDNPHVAGAKAAGGSESKGASKGGGKAASPPTRSQAAAEAHPMRQMGLKEQARVTTAINDTLASSGTPREKVQAIFTSASGDRRGMDADIADKLDEVVGIGANWKSGKEAEMLESITGIMGRGKG